MIMALEPTAYSFGFAYASGGGSPPAVCLKENLQSSLVFGVRRCLLQSSRDIALQEIAVIA